MQIENLPYTTFSLNKKEYLYFSGTSYLSVAALPEFQELVIKSIKKWGASYGSSRNANIKLTIYEKGETYFANFLNTEAALTVSSGTLAGQFAIKTLNTMVDEMYALPKTHPAILPQNVLPVFNDWVINSSLKLARNKKIGIVLDAIPALETKPFSLDFLNEIDISNTIYLVIDESHSLGVLGENGCGISSEIHKKENIEIIVASSLGKALGITGGVIAGSANFIDLIKKDNLFIGSAGMSPAFLEVFIHAKEIYKTQLKKLQQNIAYVYKQLKDNSEISIDSSYPVFFHSNENIDTRLLKENILITSFYYPTSTKKFNRIVLNANHTKEQLDTLIHTLS